RCGTRNADLGRGGGHSDRIFARKCHARKGQGGRRYQVKDACRSVPNIGDLVMPVRFLISTLKPGVDPADYEAWVRDRDYALVRSLPNYVSYKVHRIRPPIQGAA